VARKKNADGESSIYQGADGSWHGRVSVGLRDDGTPDRRHVRGQSEAAVRVKVRRLERERDTGTVANAGERWTVGQWLEHWLEYIAEPFVRTNTYVGYRGAVRNHLVPGLGAHKLAKLRPEHVERLYVTMLKRTTRRGTPTKPATVHQVHRTLRAALNEAVKRGHLPRNPVLLARVPSVEPHGVEPFSVAEIQVILVKALEGRNGARWAIALALGLRQGEVLGLKWADVDFETRTLTVRCNRLRPTYAHGCGAKPCGRKHAGYCPARVHTRPDAAETKSQAGKRAVGLPDALFSLLLSHRSAQDIERQHAAQLWREGGWLFANELGQPLNPRTDWTRWKALLVAAGVRDARLHDARHTAATVLLLLGVPERATMGVMGWSNPAMLARYAHMVAPIRRDIADRVGGLIWTETQAGTDEGKGLR
jgi:integrase